MDRVCTDRTSWLAPVLVLLLAGVACRAAPSAPSTPALETPTFGAASPQVELLTFIDWECPFSRQEGAALRDLVAHFPTQLQVRVLYWPLDLHPHSLLAARAAVAASEQQAFPTFWQKWLQPDASLSREALITWAVEAGLDAKRFVRVMEDPRTQARVARDVAIGHALNVTGTPSFLLNGKLLTGQQSLAALAAGVQHELDETAILQAAGAEKGRLIHARVAQNTPELLVNYDRYVERGLLAPQQPVPVVTHRTGVVDAQIHPAALDASFGGQRALMLPDQTTTSEATVWRVVVRPDDPQMGKRDAPVTAVLFLDLFAQETALLLPWLLQLPIQHPEQIRLVIKHLPRPIHPLARSAAEALEAAREQNLFLPLLQKLVDAPQPLTQAALLSASTQVGLDPARFNSALAAHSGGPRIEADIDQAAALGVRGFAALYINGVPVPQLSESAVQTTLDAQAKVAANLARRGTARAAIYETLTEHGKLLDALAPEAHLFDLNHAAVQGLPGAAVQIVVFGDFQCPFTARIWPHLRKLDEEMPGRLKIAWLDFPQTAIHPLAEKAAEWGQEARRQGKFWSFVETLARRVDLLDDRSLWQAAHEAGLKDRPLQQALAKHQWTQAVQAERAQGEQAGVRGTPTVFLDGHLFQPTNGISADTLRPAIRQLLGTH